MKVYSIEAVKNHVCDLLGDTVPVSVTFPDVETHFVMVPPMDSDNLIGPVGEMVKNAIEDDDVFYIPTEVGNGVIVNLRDWFTSNWAIWGISPTGKFLMYKPGEFHIFSMDDLGEYLCDISGCESVGYAPSETKLGLEIVISKEDYETELGEVIKAITAETVGDEANPNMEVLENLKTKADKIIWGDRDVFVCPGKDETKLYVFGKQFQDFLDNFQDMADVIVAEADGDPMEDAIKGCLDDIAALVEKKDIEVLGNDVADVIEMLRDIVSEGKAGEAIDTMASMFLD